MWIQPKKDMDIIKDNIFQSNYSHFSSVKLNGTFEEAICVSNHNNEYKVNMPLAYYSRTGKYLFSPTEPLKEKVFDEVKNKNWYDIAQSLYKYNTIGGNNIFQRFNNESVLGNDKLACNIYRLLPEKKYKDQLFNALFIYSDFQFSKKVKSIPTSDLYLSKSVVTWDYYEGSYVIEDESNQYGGFMLNYGNETIVGDLEYLENGFHTHAYNFKSDKLFKDIFDKKGNIIEHPTLKDMKITSTQHFVWSFEPEIVEKYLTNRKQGEKIILDDKDKQKQAYLKILFLNVIDNESYLFDCGYTETLENLLCQSQEIKINTAIVNILYQHNTPYSFYAGIHGTNVYEFKYQITYASNFPIFVGMPGDSKIYNHREYPENIVYEIKMVYFKNNEKNNKVFGFLSKNNCYDSSILKVHDVDITQIIKQVKNGDNFFFAKMETYASFKFHVYGVDKENRLVVFTTNLLNGNLNGFTDFLNVGNSKFYIEPCMYQIAKYNRWIVFTFHSLRSDNKEVHYLFFLDMKTGKIKIVSYGQPLGKLIFKALGTYGDNIYINPFGQIKICQSLESIDYTIGYGTNGKAYDNAILLFEKGFGHYYKNWTLIRNMLQEERSDYFYEKIKNKIVGNKNDVENEGNTREKDSPYGLSSFFKTTPYLSGVFIPSTFNFILSDKFAKAKKEDEYSYKVEYILNSKDKIGIAYPIKYGK